MNRSSWETDKLRLKKVEYSLTKHSRKIQKKDFFFFFLHETLMPLGCSIHTKVKGSLTFIKMEKMKAFISRLEINSKTVKHRFHTRTDYPIQAEMAS